MVDFEREKKKNPELNREDVERIKEWMLKQPHLPLLTEDRIVIFLHSCYYKLDATKKTIECYFNIRTNATELFSNRDPHSKEIQEALETMHMVKLPTKTAEGYDIFFSKLNRPETRYFNSVDVMKAYHMHGDISYNAETVTSPGIIYVVDMEGCSMTHMLKINPIALKNHFLYLQDALPVRLKAIHLLNSAAVVGYLMSLIKPFVKAELLNRIHSYTSGSEEIYQFVPRTSLPADYGGELPPLRELHAETKKIFEEHDKWFKTEVFERIDKCKKPRKPDDDIDDSNLVGTFKKITFD